MALQLVVLVQLGLCLGVDGFVLLTSIAKLSLVPELLFSQSGGSSAHEQPYFHYRTCCSSVVHLLDAFLDGLRDLIGKGLNFFPTIDAVSELVLGIFLGVVEIWTLVECLVEVDYNGAESLVVDGIDIGLLAIAHRLFRLSQNTSAEFAAHRLKLFYSEISFVNGQFSCLLFLQVFGQCAEGGAAKNSIAVLLRGRIPIVGILLIVVPQLLKELVQHRPHQLDLNWDKFGNSEHASDVIWLNLILPTQSDGCKVE